MVGVEYRDCSVVEFGRIHIKDIIFLAAHQLHIIQDVVQSQIGRNHQLRVEKFDFPAYLPGAAVNECMQHLPLCRCPACLVGNLAHVHERKADMALRGKIACVIVGCRHIVPIFIPLKHSVEHVEYPTMERLSVQGSCTPVHVVVSLEIIAPSQLIGLATDKENPDRLVKVIRVEPIPDEAVITLVKFPALLKFLDLPPGFALVLRIIGLVHE